MEPKQCVNSVAFLLKWNVVVILEEYSESSVGNKEQAVSLHSCNEWPPPGRAGRGILVRYWGLVFVFVVVVFSF